MKNRKLVLCRDILITVFGCAVFALGLDVFLLPREINAGGISGLGMIVVNLTDFGSVGLVTTLMNIPLFILGGIKVGKRFFLGSLVGMIFTSLFIDLLAFIPKPDLEPLVCAIYGGVICGFGLGCVFTSGFTTGGSDIIIRLCKMKWPNMQIGAISTIFDLCVAVLTGVVFRNLQAALYSGIAIFITGQVINIVVYHFDYSKVALIISKDSEKVAECISQELNRGVTFLYGEGAYSGQKTKVILTAIKKQQLADLKELVVSVDPEAFIIVQEAHQVLGDGFSRYSKDAL